MVTETTPPLSAEEIYQKLLENLEGIKPEYQIMQHITADEKKSLLKLLEGKRNLASSMAPGATFFYIDLIDNLFGGGKEEED